jgi:hypothetical protein
MTAEVHWQVAPHEGDLRSRGNRSQERLDPADCLVGREDVHVIEDEHDRRIVIDDATQRGEDVEVG